MNMSVKLILIGVCSMGFSAVLANTTHPFTVQKGDNCTDLVKNTISGVCGATNILYIGKNSDMSPPAWCTFKDGAWHGSLVEGQSGYYVCGGG